MNYIEKTKYSNFLELIKYSDIKDERLNLHNYLGLTSSDFYCVDKKVYTYDHSSNMVYKIIKPQIFFTYLLKIMEVQDKLHVFEGMNPRTSTSSYVMLSKSTMEYCLDENLYVKPDEIQKLLIFWANLKEADEV